jgi:MauM/NapG family ferredoxin protein
LKTFILKRLPSVSERLGINNRIHNRILRHPWITARKFFQYLALILFIILFIFTRQEQWPAGVVNFPLRLDPLVMLSHLLASRTFLTGSVLALIVVAITFVVGRAWCGWLCPLGTILDIFNFFPRRFHQQQERKTLNQGWRSVKYFLLIIILVAALLGNLSLLIFDPLTLLFRTLTTSIWPAMDQIVTALEIALFGIPFLAGPVSTFDSWIRPQILPPFPIYYRHALFFGFLFLIVILLNFVTMRFWCQYLCPLGALLGMLSKFALINRKVGDKCKGCKLCSQICPTATIDPDKQYASDPGECTVCLECLEYCPPKDTHFTPGLSFTWNEYDPNRRQALLAITLTIPAIAMMGRTSHKTQPHSHLLRPPGSLEDDMLSKCIRCGECMRACPTAGLQPAVSEAGLEGLFTPVLIPRLGYCDYSCAICGRVCPVDAIPNLDLDAKRMEVIGKAYIDHNHCIAWSDRIDCIVCEEMCPLPEKAIYLEEHKEINGNNIEEIILLPHVDRSLCVGCGICEYKCPIEGQSAIRVFIS